MPEARRIETRSRASVAAEWDRIARIRDDEIAGGADISFTRIVMPTLLALVPKVDAILDVGCGTGIGSLQLLQRARRVLGIDPSGESIRIAQGRATGGSTFEKHWVEDYEREGSHKFDAIVANMVLMNMPNLHDGVRAMARMLRPNGYLVCTVIHPWFWPNYWEYATADWFDYSREIAIEAPFRISKHDAGLPTTHVHRPLQAYVSELQDNGLAIDSLVEPMPTTELERLYPEPWHYPRFLAFRARPMAIAGSSTSNI